MARSTGQPSHSILT